MSQNARTLSAVHYQSLFPWHVEGQGHSILVSVTCGRSRSQYSIGQYNPHTQVNHTLLSSHQGFFCQTETAWNVNATFFYLAGTICSLDQGQGTLPKKLHIAMSSFDCQNASKSWYSELTNTCYESVCCMLPSRYHFDVVCERSRSPRRMYTAPSKLFSIRRSWSQIVTWRDFWRNVSNGSLYSIWNIYKASND